MLTSFMVVDDFLANPHEVREAALQLDYPEPEEKPYFPGRNSRQPLIIDGLEDEISRLVGEQLVPVAGTSHRLCRVALAKDKGRGDVHIDYNCHWSAILYLSLPEDCQGGTEFFRHIRTNTERCPLYEEELPQYGFETFDDLGDKLLTEDSTDRSKWEQTMNIPMRFNRLVLIRPWLWHTAGPGFGDTIENGRLVQLFFFKGVGAR